MDDPMRLDRVAKKLGCDEFDIIDRLEAREVSAFCLLATLVPEGSHERIQWMATNDMPGDFMVSEQVYSEALRMRCRFVRVTSLSSGETWRALDSPDGRVRPCGFDAIADSSSGWDEGMVRDSWQRVRRAANELVGIDAESDWRDRGEMFARLLEVARIRSVKGTAFQSPHGSFSSGQPLALTRNDIYIAPADVEKLRASLAAEPAFEGQSRATFAASLWAMTRAFAKHAPARYGTADDPSVSEIARYVATLDPTIIGEATLEKLIREGAKEVSETPRKRGPKASRADESDKPKRVSEKHPKTSARSRTKPA